MNNTLARGRDGGRGLVLYQCSVGWKDESDSKEVPAYIVGVSTSVMNRA